MNGIDFLAGLKRTLPVYLCLAGGNLGYSYYAHGKITADAVHTVIQLSVVAGIMIPVIALIHWRIRLREERSRE